MDKPNKGNTIKIKLNGETKNYLEEPKKIQPEPIIESNPIEIEVDSKNRDSDVFSETAASQESIDESFDWIIPESSDHDIEEFTFAGQKKTKKPSLPTITSFSLNPKKKKDRNIISILISVAFAVLLGTTIGVVMLKLVITGPTDKTSTDLIPTVVDDKGSTTNENSGANTNTVTLEQLTTYVIQGGVFSSKDGAKETSAQITSKGVPNQLIEMNNKQYLFLGVADSIENAKSLGGTFKSDGVEEVFSKTLVLDKKEVSGLNEQEKSFLENVPAIYQTLSLITSTALVNNDLPAKSTKELTNIETQLKASGLKNDKVKTIKTELTTAVDKLNTYQSSKSKKNLTQAQQHLLNFLSAYYSL